MIQSKMKYLLSFFLLTVTFMLNAQQQNGYWQQHVDYQMDVQVDVDDFTFTGTQKLTYTNNSPESLKRVYYHMYFNAFQPGSEMDMRLQQIEDPDRRMVNSGASRIADLQPNEIGYLRATSLMQDGQPVSYGLAGTILEVELAEPIPSGGSAFHEPVVPKNG